MKAARKPASTTGRAERPNQKRRTRKDLLQAAARLMKGGGTPSLEAIAEEAMVSRATAYRYFPGLEALLLEASFDVATPEAETLFPPGAPGDAAARLERVDDALDAMIRANEPALRTFLARNLESRARVQSNGGQGNGGQGNGGQADSDVPARQNRRSPLIDAALSPTRAEFKPGQLDLLRKALALVIGTEAIVVCKDVLQLDEAEARKVRRWAIRALVAAARK